jgi:hypothetical protein
MCRSRQESFKFRDVPIVCLALVSEGTHFNIVSNYPLMDGVELKAGKEDEYVHDESKSVPETIEAVEDNVAMCPIVNTCMRCKKLIL